MSNMFGNLFDFSSKEEKQKRYEDYAIKIFPYGDNQRQKVLNLLTDLFPKLNSKYVMMYFVLIKEYTMGESAMSFDEAAAQTKKHRLLKITPELLAGIEAVLDVDKNINEDLEYPSIEEIKAAVNKNCEK